MCAGISLVISRARIHPYCISGENSHEKIKEAYKLHDTNGINPSILPVEFHPTGELTDVSTWEFCIDYPINELPDWYRERSEEYETECRHFLRKEIDKINKTGKYDGSLYFNGMRVTSLGKLTHVGGYLDLYGTNITSLGNLTYVGGSLDLRNTPIRSLGNLTHVGDILYVYNTRVTSLGNLAHVGGCLDLYGTNIRSLGKLTHVGGYLDIRNTPIRSLGNLTHVGREIMLTNNQAATLRCGISATVPVTITGN